MWPRKQCLEQLSPGIHGKCPERTLPGQKKFYKVRSRRTPAGFFSIPQQGLMFAGCSMHVYWMGCSNNILICVFQPKNTSSFVAKFHESWAMSQNSWQQFFDKQFSISTKFQLTIINAGNSWHFGTFQAANLEAAAAEKDWYSFLIQDIPA